MTRDSRPLSSPKCLRPLAVLRRRCSAQPRASRVRINRSDPRKTRCLRCARPRLAPVVREPANQDSDSARAVANSPMEESNHTTGRSWLALSARVIGTLLAGIWMAGMLAGAIGRSSPRGSGSVVADVSTLPLERRLSRNPACDPKHRIARHALGVGVRDRTGPRDVRPHSSKNRPPYRSRLRIAVRAALWRHAA